MPPAASPGIVEELGAIGLNERRARDHGEAVRHRPRLGARAERDACTTVFDESQVFRIDHFLGKEAVQNILALRFANGMFEPVWNRDHIDHVQIDVPETLSIGTRGGFYEGTGAFRDMVVTHLFQVLGFVAMEPPTSLEPKALVAEKTKVFDSMPPLDPADVVRGQYEGYRDEDGRRARLRHRDVRRAAGVRRQLALGGRARSSCAPASASPRAATCSRSPSSSRRGGCSRSTATTWPSRSAATTSPSSSATRAASRRASSPRCPARRCSSAKPSMDFSYADAFGGAEHALEAYERLHPRRDDRRPHALQHVGGDRAAVGDLRAGARGTRRRCEPYEPGSWGPPEADELIAPRRWHVSEHA